MNIYRYFTAKEVVNVTGVSYRRLDYWIREGIVRCSGRKAFKKGTPRLFTFSDIVEVKVVHSLVGHGLRLNAVRECIRQLRKVVLLNNEYPLATARLITDGKTIFRYLSEDDALESMDEFGQFAFSFGIGNEINDLSSKIIKSERSIRYTRKDINSANINIKEAIK